MTSTRQNKLRVAVLYGGKSGEHEVSLVSAASVISALDQEKFEVIPIGIDKQGVWHMNALPKLSKQEPLQLSVLQPHSRIIPLPQAFDASTPFDVIFPVVHGPLCEDGCLQGLLELTGLPYVGSGVLSSALAMDKDFTKRWVKAHGIPTSPHLALQSSADAALYKQFCQEAEATLGFPLFVKPARLGSSVGISRVTNVDELMEAMIIAFRYDHKIIMEKAVQAREVEVAVLENPEYGARPCVSIAGEIAASEKHAFYSYEAKYIDPEGAIFTIPARISEQHTQDAQKMAQEVFTLLECEGMARVDFFIEKTTGKLFFNEINTIPGFTSISMFPKLWKACGVSYTELLTRLIDLALARQKRKGCLITEYGDHDMMTQVLKK